MSAHVMRVYSIECDLCGEAHDSPGSTSVKEAREDAREHKWERARDVNGEFVAKGKLADVCPACARKHSRQRRIETVY